MLKATLYTLPSGGKTSIDIKNIEPEDAAFFNDNGFEVSLETLLDGKFVIYSTTGIENDDGEEIEKIYIVPEGEECQVSMKKLRELVEKHLQS